MISLELLNSLVSIFTKLISSICSLPLCLYVSQRNQLRHWDCSHSEFTFSTSMRLLWAPSSLLFAHFKEIRLFLASPSKSYWSTSRPEVDAQESSIGMITWDLLLDSLRILVLKALFILHWGFYCTVSNHLSITLVAFSSCPFWSFCCCIVWL